MDEIHAFCAHVRIDPGEGFIQKDEPRRQRVCCSIEGGSRGKMGQGERDSFFTSGTCAMGSAGEPFPDAILIAFHAERMPLAVVQRLSKEFLPAGVLHIGTHGVNLLLERPAQHLPFCRRPFVVHLHQTPNCLGHP